MNWKIDILITNLCSLAVAEFYVNHSCLNFFLSIIIFRIFVFVLWFKGMVEEASRNDVLKSLKKSVENWWSCMANRVKFRLPDCLTHFMTNPSQYGGNFTHLIIINEMFTITDFLENSTIITIHKIKLKLSKTCFS